MKAARILIAGAAGFVGTHVLKALAAGYPAPSRILATSKTPLLSDGGADFEELDIVDAGAVARTVSDFQPTHIIHLAGISSVSMASQDSSLAWEINVTGTLNIAKAVTAHAPDCVLLFAGSGEVYGTTANQSEKLDETSLLAPTNEYAVSKAAADLALGAMASRGLRTIRFRPFNHTGAGQSDRFVVPAFARQIALIEAGLQEPVLSVGNLEAQRDFLDVADVVDAYLLGIARSDTLPPGVILNLASGIPRKIGDILDQLLSQSSCRIEVRPDQERLRPNEVPRSVGDATRAGELLGWIPRRRFEHTLQNILQDVREQIAQSG